MAGLRFFILRRLDAWADLPVVAPPGFDDLIRAGSCTLDAIVNGCVNHVNRVFLPLAESASSRMGRAKLSIDPLTPLPRSTLY
jgi:hypothetical protein